MKNIPKEKVINCLLCHKDFKKPQEEKLWICKSCRIKMAETLDSNELMKIIRKKYIRIPFFGRKEK